MDNAIDNLGAMAEMVSIFYNTLIKQGIPENVAVELSKTILTVSISVGFQK